MGFFDRSTEEITRSPVGRVLVILAGPIFVQNVVHVLQQLIDLYWLGRHSSAGIAAVGLAVPVILFLLKSTISATFVGTQVLVSQRIGADSEEGARRALFTGLVVTALLGLGIGGLMFFNVGTLIEAISSVRPGGTDATTLLYARRYLRVIALGVVFAGLSDVVEAAFLGWGDSRSTLYVNVATVMANSVATPIFMFGVGPVPAMGITGAAIGTVGGYLSGFLLGVALAVGGPHDLFSWSAATLDRGEVRELLDVGLPHAVKGGADSVGDTVLVVLIFSVAGSAGMVAYTVSSRVGTVAFRTTDALNQAAQTVVGQNLGADQPDRALRTVWTGAAISAGLLLVLGGAQYLFPGTLTRLLSPEVDGRAFALSTAALRIVAISYPAFGVLALVRAGFNGARRTKTTMAASLAQTWLLYIPLALAAVFAFEYGVTAVFWADTIATFVVALGLGGYFVYSTNRGMYQRATEQVD
ncbi:MATE family efflux transporter [Halobacteriales archaeon QS_1_68_20]|nr:MAG: MATE family efflux transporter [Halobacteriales archaeon QS_1_68_20]